MTNPATLELSVSGMHCGACVQHVGHALRGVDGVLEADVDLPGGRATVRYDSETTGPEALVAAVARAGYTAAIPEGADGGG